MPIVPVIAPGQESRYDIHIGSGLLASCAALFAPYSGCRAVIVADSNTAPLYGNTLLAQLEQAGVSASLFALPAGEATKCPEQLARLYDAFLDARLTRKDLVIALGGGVIGDITGYAAATYMRGARFVQVPTTLLAQVDSSVGGKVAVDLPQGKNLVGAFYQPDFVLVDPDTLNTLTDEYWRDGLGEVVKYGCIGDEALFALLENAAPGGRASLMTHIDEILRRCIQHKADVVAQDERDTGLRMTLNFGHTIAHAVETCQHYEGFRHGEAVALGMHLMTRLSEEKGLTAPGTADRLDALLRALGMPMALPALKKEDVISAMLMDKKFSGQVLRAIVLNKIGKCFIHPTDVSFFDGMTM